MTSTTIDPIGTAQAALQQAKSTEAADVKRAIALVEHKLVREQETFNAKWGVGWNEKQRDNVPELNADATALHGRLMALKDEKRMLEAQLAKIPHQLARGMQHISESTVVGPSIPVPGVTLPSVSGDRTLHELETKCETAVSDRQKLVADITAIEAVQQSTEQDVATLTTEHGLGIAAPDKLAAATKKLRTIEKELASRRERLARTERTIDTCGQESAARKHAIAKERRETIARELQASEVRMSDKLLDLMGESTLHERLVKASDEPGDYWALSALSADAPRSLGRERLQRAMEHGWTPKAR